MSNPIILERLLKLVKDGQVTDLDIYVKAGLITNRESEKIAAEAAQ